MSDASQLQMMKMDTKTTLKASDIHFRDFSLDAKAAPSLGGDVLDRINRAARQPTQSAGAITLGAVDVDFGSLRADLGDEGPEAKLLREAKRLVNERQYAPAIGRLHEVLALDPHHHEAIYLIAFCQFHLKQVSAAATTLGPLHNAELSNRLRTRVRGLRDDIRQVTLPAAAKIYEAAIKSQPAAEKAVEPLAEFVANDPGMGKFHCFLAGTLLVAQLAAEARQAVARAREMAETDQEELEQIAAMIDRRLFSPAREHFRAKRYVEARKSLAEMPESTYVLPMWRSFDGYLQYLAESGRLKSRGGAGGTVEPPGSRETINALFEFLAAPEMKQARDAIGRSDRPAAEKSLRAALQYVPPYSVANHLLATCVYQRVGANVKGLIGSDLDDDKARQLHACKKELDAAAPLAECAAGDREISDAASLLGSIRQMSQEIETVVDRFEAQAHDAPLVNKLIDDFIPVLMGVVELNIMLSGSPSPWEVRSKVVELHSRLSKSRSELPRLRKECRGNNAREIIDLVMEKFIEPNYQVLHGVMRSAGLA